MITSDLLLVTAHVDMGGGFETIELAGLSVLPRIGDEVALDYWHGKKVAFLVEGVRHQIANIGSKMLQQVQLTGRAI